MELVKQYGAFAAALILALAGFTLGDYSLMAWLGAATLASAGVIALNPRWGLLSSSLLGLGCSLYLFWRKLDDTGHAICNVSSKINCDVVNSSPASEIFGIPIALLGTGFFLGVAIASFLRGSAQRVFGTAGLLSLVGIVYSLYLAFEAWKIGAVCVMCITIYASVGLILASSLLGAKAEGEGAIFDDVPSTLRSNSLITISATLVVVVLFGLSAYSGRAKRPADEVIDQLAHNKPQPGQVQPGQVQPPPKEDLLSKLAEMYVAPRGAVMLEGDEPTLGDPNAPYTVLEYACFGCPHCAQSFPHLFQLVKENPEIKVKFRSFPLTGECNAAAARTGRPEVCRAAMAAQCANQQGKFWDFAGLVFANQQQLGDELLAAAANQVGLDFDAFSRCITDPAVLQAVSADAASGAAVQIMGTPTMFLEGVRGPGEWVEVCFGASEVQALVQAHKQGIPLPPPRGGTCPME